MGLIADMLNRRYARQDRDEWSNAMPGLMGSAGGDTLAGPPEPGQQGPLQTEGYGLMADPSNLGNQMDFAQGLMDLPGGAQLAVPQMFSSMRQEDQQAHQIQDRVQQHQNQLEADSNRSAATMMRDQFNSRRDNMLQSFSNLRNGVPEGWDNLKEYLQGESSFRKEARAALTPYREPLEKANSLFGRLDEIGGDLNQMTGSDDANAIMVGMKILNPGEAVNVDDRDSMREGLGGAPGMLAMYEAWLSGDGQLGPEQRGQLFESLGPLIRNAEANYIQQRAPFESAVKGRFTPSKVMSDRYEINRGSPEVSGLFGYEPESDEQQYEYRTLPDGTRQRRAID